jgi:radical SAM protein with 4Fe4S-binding SPASM domain
MIELTNTCNAKCPLCPTGSDSLDRNKGFISTSLFAKIMKEIAQLAYKVQLSSWNYGEPFMHPQWFELFSMIPENVNHKTSTNGLVFYKQETIDLLAKSNLNECIVSIDGSTKEFNATYRKGVDLDRIYEGLKYFREKYGQLIHRPKIKIQTVLFPYNKDDLVNIKSRFEGLYDEIYYKLPNFNMTEYNETNEINRQTQLKVIETIPNSCSMFSRSFVINWNGDCNPCCHDYQGHVIIGNANSQTINEIFNSDKSREFYARIITNRKQNDICKVCPIDRRTNLIKHNIINY